jgi:hypothetical protein
MFLYYRYFVIVYLCLLILLILPLVSLLSRDFFECARAYSVQLRTS